VNGSSLATETRMAPKCLLGSGTADATCGKDGGRVDAGCVPTAK
jgi:hypothetical protein